MTPADLAEHVQHQNVRVVDVDDHEQPRYLRRAAALEEAFVVAAAAFGVEPADMPGLHGLCVDAVRRADRADR